MMIKVMVFISGAVGIFSIVNNSCGCCVCWLCSGYHGGINYTPNFCAQIFLLFS